ncbi:MAG: SDR family oxidoreductase, partial [Clostridia bacterium]|nr:SDR family oxidoreductase [Clostridia bacterium]
MDFDMNAANIAMLKNYIATSRPMEEMFSVKGKVAIVTGATSGLGFNIALRLLQGGANVVIAGSSQAKGDYTIPLLEEAGYGQDRVMFCRTNVSNEADMENLIKSADEKFGSIDIYVNSAAIWSYAHIYDLPAEEFRRVIDTNISGAFLGIKHVSNYMIEHKVQGKITLISSNCAWLPYPVFGGYPHYAASKGGVNSLAIEAAKELKRYGIMVNVVAPGGMVTAGASSN